MNTHAQGLHAAGDPEPADVPGPRVDGGPGAVTGSDDRIRLQGIEAVGHHGVLAQERRDGQRFVADVVVHLDTRPAAAHDDLSRTVDYAELSQRVADVLAGEPAALLETVAERIAAEVLAYRAVGAVEVAVHKPQAPLPVPFVDVVVEVRRDREHLPAVQPWRPGPVADLLGEAPDVLDRAPAAPAKVVLALGANLGDALGTLRDAVGELAGLPGVDVVAVSPLARTAAVGGPEQPDFLNAVLIARTTLSPRELLRAVQGVEEEHGRVRTTHWGPRTLDIDIITYEGVVTVADDLHLPHRRAHERAFVLEPWVQIDPDVVLPGLGGGPVAALAATAPDAGGIRWLALDWLTTPVPSAVDLRGPA